VDHVEAARRFFGAGDDIGIDAMPELWADDDRWEWRDPPELPDAKVVRGRAAVQEHVRALWGWEGLELGPADVSAVGDDVVLAVMPLAVSGARSGLGIGREIAQVLFFEDGRVRRTDVFLSRDAALAALAARGD
jgi:ketosteroid isomerase-like protein